MFERWCLSFRHNRMCYSLNRASCSNTGTTIAFTYSLVAVLMSCSNPMFHSRHFFETSVFLITFVVLGKYMEAVAKGKTSRAIQQLMEMVCSSSSQSRISPLINHRTHRYHPKLFSCRQKTRKALLVRSMQNSYKWTIC